MLAAVQATLKQVLPSYSEERDLQICMPCQVLTKSCVHCRAHDVEYHSHSLSDCTLNKANELHPEWKTWSKFFRLPLGCCFFCSCRLKACLLCLVCPSELTFLQRWTHCTDDIYVGISPGAASPRSHHRSNLSLGPYFQASLIHRFPRCSTCAEDSL
jgi:hypothetical protein